MGAIAKPYPAAHAYRRGCADEIVGRGGDDPGTRFDCHDVFYRLDASRSASGNTRPSFAEAPSFAGAKPDNPSGRKALNPKESANASSSVNINGGKRKPGRSR